jgi:glyoxylase I family protein
MFVLEHGYCASVYDTDPHGMVLERTVDHPKAASGAAERQARVHAELKRWLGGNHTSNNNWRGATDGR